MTRSTAREIAMHLAYELSFTDMPVEEFLDQQLSAERFAALAGEDALYEELPNAKQMAYIRRLVSGVAEHAAELDGDIEKYAKGWRFERISLVASAIMRVAMYEVLYMADIPEGVAISDFAADRRASTPSNAAEIAVPDMAELLRWLDGAEMRMARGVTRQLGAARERLDTLAQKRVLTDPMALVADKGMQLDHVQHRLAAAMRAVTDRENGRFAALAASLDALSPLRVLGRGYALAQTEDGTVLRSAAQTAAGQRIRVRLAQGQLVCDVAETKEA